MFTILLCFSAFLDIVIISMCAPVILGMMSGSEVSFQLVGIEISAANKTKLIYLVTLLLIFKIIYQLLLFRKIYKDTFDVYNNIVKQTLKKIFKEKGQDTASQLSVSITSELEEFVKTIILPTFQLISEMILIVFVVLYLLYLDYAMMLSIILIALVLYVGFTKFIAQRLYVLGAITRDSRLNLIDIAQFAALQKADIRSLTAEKYFEGRVLKVMRTFSATSSLYQFMLSMPRLVIELVGLLGLVILAGVSEILNVSSVTLTLFGIAILRLLPAIQRVYVAYTQIKFGSRTLAFLENLINDVDNEPTISTPVRFRDFSISEKSKGYGLNFKKNGEQLYFECKHGLNLLFGASGVGKSQFIRSLQNYHLKTSKYSTATMQQDAYLFNGSLYENIVLGRDYDENRLSALLDILFKNDKERFNLASLPEISVSDNGLGLSGGQVQRICILRTLLVKKQFYFIDEGFANLNPELRDMLFGELHKFLKMDESTAIVVTHSYNESHVYNNMELV